MMLTPEELQSWLEWAGERIITIKVSRIFPSELHSSWPEYPNDKFTAYGYTNIKLKSQPPTREEIPVMDEILDLVHLVPQEISRRILNARALVIPPSLRHKFSWVQIAALVDSYPGKVKTLHQKGLEFICRRVGNDQMARVRTHLKSNQFP